MLLWGGLEQPVELQQNYVRGLFRCRRISLLHIRWFRNQLDFRLRGSEIPTEIVPSRFALPFSVSCVGQTQRLTDTTWTGQDDKAGTSGCCSVGAMGFCDRCLCAVSACRAAFASVRRPSVRLA